MAYIVADISLLSPLLGIVVGCIHFKSLPKFARYVVAIMLLSFLSDGISILYGKFFSNNLIVIHSWGLLDGVLLFLLFRLLIPRFSTLIVVLMVLFIIGYTIDSFWITGLTKFNGLARAAEGIVMIMLCMLYFYQVYVSESNIFIDKSPEFWIVVAILVYVSVALFSFLLSTEIFTQSPDRFYGSWILHNVANITKNMLLTLALWKARPRLTSN